MKTKITLIGFFIFFLHYIAVAQCSPYIGSVGKTTAVICEGETINLYANSPGYTTTILWKFGNGDQSTNRNTNYVYNTSGLYTITYTGSGFAGSCTKTLSVVVKPSPDIDVSLVSADSQCFEDNNFCLTDLSTAPFGKIAEMRYIFSDGQQFDTLYPTFPVNLCKFFGDPAGGSYDMVVQAYDTGGCVAQEVYQNFTYVSPKIGTSFTNTSNTTIGCNGTLGSFVNTSTLTRSKIDSFEWHYGDGTVRKGTKDSVLLWDSTSHLYTTGGSYDVTLKTYASTGCIDEYTIKEAIINISLKPKITKNKDIFSSNENPISFGVIGLGTAEPINQFTWNFGEPSSGLENVNSTTLTPTHSFDLGPKLVTLRIQAGPCDVTALDTIQVVGPQAQIEAINNRISQAEKIQCGTADSIHFSNASLFYQNDNNPFDEDSVIFANGTSKFAFNYIPPSNGIGLGTGDQTALTSATHIANRTMGSQVQRIWDFGDEYAPQCTTSLAKGLNIGINCNYSEDELPVHKYRSWDSVYHNDYYSINDTFKCTKYTEATNSCYIENIDTSNATEHRKIFDKTVPREYTATLWLRDTITNRESMDKISIDLRKPDASKMALVSGTPCPFFGTTDYQLEFEMNAGGKSYFAVNFDSLSYGATGFTPYNRGTILAPPKPGIPFPFLLPYNITGGLGDKFVKGYTPGEIGNTDLRTPKGSFTMGLIIGKGPLTANGGPPTCVDTAWYTDIFRIPTLDANFKIVAPSANKKYICAGESATFEIDEPFQNDIATLRWNWGHQGNGKGPSLDLYVEEFKYLEKYNGPSPTRNDKDIAYSGENWLYNYVVRSTINDFSGITVLDTIVSSIIKDWKTEATYENQATYNALSQNLGCTEIPKEQMYKLWGDGTFGCIDTTGLSQSISTNLSEYRKYNGDKVFMQGNKRYRYTNPAHTDSTEVAHVLHFRDSSLQGFDTLIVDTDTTEGVWKKEYTYQKVEDGDTLTLRAKGALSPSLSLTNTTGCQSQESQFLNVGFIAEFSLIDSNLCAGLDVEVDNYIRYYQNGIKDPSTYPISTHPYWRDPNRYTSSPSKEVFRADWDKNDNRFDSTRSIPTLRWRYDTPREYTITVVAEDTTGCTDTTELDVTVSETTADFTYTEDFSNCKATINFTDNSTVSTPKDSILSWQWDFGDGTRNSILQNPSHNYTSGGIFEVTLVVNSANGCQDSITKEIFIPGPQPEFDFIKSLVFGEDPAQICPGEQFRLINTSKGNPFKSPTFLVIWGDGTTGNGGSIGDTVAHTYTVPGTYELYLIMEDEIPGTGTRCSRIYPDTNSNLIAQQRMEVFVNTEPSVSMSVGTSPTYVGHPTSFIANLDPTYTRINWFMGNGESINLPTAANKQIIYKFSQTGIYHVILAPEFNPYPRCWDRDTFTIQVLDASLNSINEPSIGLEIFPNPAYDKVQIISKEGANILKIEVTDLFGKSYSPTTTIARDNATIDVSNLPASYYILRIETDKGTKSQKIQVTRE